MEPAPGHPPAAWPRTRLVWLLSLVLAILAAAPAAHAADIATLQARVDGAKAQARNLASAVQLRTAELEAAQTEAASAARRQQVLEAELAQSVARARELEARVTAAQERLAKAQARFQRMQRMLSNRLVAIYKSDTPDLATVLLEADGFDDLLTRTAYLQEINKADLALVDRVQALRNGVRAALARVRVARAQAAAEVERVAAARDEIARDPRGGSRPGPRALARARAAQQSALASLRSRMAGWEAQVRELRRRWAPPATPAGAVEQWFDGFAIPKAIVMCESGGNYGARESHQRRGRRLPVPPRDLQGPRREGRGAAARPEVRAGPPRRKALGRRPGPRQLGVLTENGSPCGGETDCGPDTHPGPRTDLQAL